MNEAVKREPVDNSHRDAGIAAREARKSSETESVVEKAAEQAAEQIEESEGEEQEGTQNHPEESADSEQEDANGKAAKPKNRGVGKRIDELTKEKYDAQRERDYWREMAMKGQPSEQKSEPVQAAPKETGEPTLESCDFDPVEFQRRYYQWARNEERRQEQATERKRQFVEAEAAFRVEHPDYDAVTRNPSLPITKAMAEEIADAENPPALAYYLGQNPNEAAAIAQMPERAMSRAIGRIEAQLSALPASPQIPRQPEPKTVTRAPAPVTTLSGAPAVKKTYDGMSMKEYDEARRKERAAKGLSNR